MNYKATEKAIFDFLYKKFQSDNSFTFSVRKKANKGAETNYFLGTENSEYFAFTQWNIPSAYKGASRDLISYKVDLRNNSCVLTLSYRMSRNPHDEQNRYNLELAKYLKKYWQAIGIDRETGADANHYDLVIRYPNAIRSIPELEKALNDFISQSYDLTNQAIDELKSVSPSWHASKIGLQEFEANIKKLNTRLKKHGETTVTNSNEQSKRAEIQEIKTLNFPLNQILFGPPGTGKTYQTRKLAYQIIQNEELGDTIEDFNKAIELFKDLKGDQIEFITFHQNYSYEDFVQGLRPDVEAKGQLSFERKDGIFKEIATKALYEFYKKSKQQSQNKQETIELDFDEMYQEFVADLKTKSNASFKTSTGSDLYLIGISKNNNLYFKHNNGRKEYTVSTSRLKKLSKAFSNIRKIKNIHNDIVTAIGGCNSTVYWVALNEFYKFKKEYQPIFEVPKEELLEDVTYQGMIDNLRNFSSEDIDVNSLNVKNYVLIIDEINRANISRVFGELITLLEPSKRFGRMEELEVQLPSGDRFVVPPNLYLIGTMNTADKSIALLDIALRRRFEFVPIFPDKHLVSDDYQALFDKMNKKIAALKSPDFTIGHSYFMADENGVVPDLKDIMNNKVIPLLCEYFMNDLKQVKRLLNDIGIQLKTEHYGILRFDGLKTEKTNDETAN